MSFSPNLVTRFSHLLRPLFRQRPPPRNPQRVILIKPCCLGDVVQATATVAALKHRYPQARLDFAVGGWSRPVLDNNPHITHLIDTGRVGQGRYTVVDLFTLARQLRRQRYDLAVTLARSPVVGLVPWLAGIPHRIGLDSFGRGFAHTIRVPVSEAPKHEAEIYLACAMAAGLKEADHQFWTEFYPAQTDQDALHLLNGNPFVVIHPAGGVNPGMQMLDKRWPPERFAALADRLAGCGFHIVLTGLADDAPLCRQVVGHMANKTAQVLAGQLTLGQFGALCRQAALFVGGDTGAMHIAVACGCKTVAIFGPSDPRRYGPFAPAGKARTLWRAVSIPEGGVGQGQVQDFNWAQGVTVDEAWDACQDLLVGREEIGD
jgi:lipopolysaccharide heptosyltransferase II